jgi:hypothetical protein
MSVKQQLDQLFAVTSQLDPPELESMDPVRRAALDQIARNLIAYGYTDNRAVDGMPRCMADALLRELEADMGRQSDEMLHGQGMEPLGLFGGGARPLSKAELHQIDLLCVANQAIRRPV